MFEMWREFWPLMLCFGMYLIMCDNSAQMYMPLNVTYKISAWLCTGDSPGSHLSVYDLHSITLYFSPIQI